jgi:hypothetical protein
MIVQKVWVTVKRNVKAGQTTYRKATYHWYGYFLFGLIPLYVVNKKVDYVE